MDPIFKRRIIMRIRTLCITFLLFFNPHVFSFELWNGLTTEMSKNEVTITVSNILGLNPKDSTRMSNEISDAMISEKLVTLKNVDTLYFISSKREYRQPKKEEGFRYNYEYDANVICYFLDKKLFAVLVKWNTDLAELKRKTIQVFDEPLDVIENGYYYNMSSSKPDFYQYIYCFLTPAHDRAIFIGDVYKNNSSSREVADYLVIDYKSLMTALQKSKKINEDKKIKDEINKKNDANSVRF